MIETLQWRFHSHVVQRFLVRCLQMGILVDVKKSYYFKTYYLRQTAYIMFLSLLVCYFVYLFICQLICQSVCPSACLLVCPSVRASVRLSFCPSSIRQSVCLSACPFVCLSFCLSVCLSFCLSVSNMKENPIHWFLWNFQDRSNMAQETISNVWGYSKSDMALGLVGCISGLDCFVLR